MQRTRLSPRNIQFQESVQIREIPRKDSEAAVSVDAVDLQPSWESNLADRETLETPPTKLKNIVIGIVIGGIILVVAIIGIVVGIIISQKTITTADNSLTYDQACQIGSNQCIASQGLSCTNNLCLCDSYYSWNSINNICTIIVNNTLSYGATCAYGSAQCNSSVELTCTGSCTCLYGKIWNVSSCVCPTGTFLNASYLCETAYSLNHSCTIGTNQCDSTKDLLCNNSICQCDYSIKYWNINFQKCMARLNYTQWCNHDSDCLPTLICPSIPGLCNCSQYLPDLVCNCPNTKYFDATLTQCVNRASFNGACLTSANYTCLMSLYCNAGTCACPVGTSWIAANTTCVASG